MWEWSRTVAQRAAATAWTRPVGEPVPTIVDPEVWTESAPPGIERTGGAESADTGPAGAEVSMGDRVGEYADSGSIVRLREYGLAG
ncbi:hypothetical protein [Nocardia spumae]|uniref:hypothetical protein n=1 Tax=Nocardia spumae TaxID=2887190 RepID=UPI001D13B8B2|nr:hypothetical protein [Nocardia spumae]